MRVQLWCDMEGVAGISVWEQVNGGAALYEEGRRLYTNEINAAVRGCKRAGATEIIVVDGHGAGGAWNFKSLIPELLESGAEYVLGYPWARYVKPLQDGFDAALFVGAHAMAGTPDGILCHTVSSQAWYNAKINDTLVGESGIIAAIAGDFNVPCVFVSGDAATCREVRDLLGPEVVEASVKTGLGRYTARHMPASDACNSDRRPRVWRAHHAPLAETAQVCRPGCLYRGTRHARPRQRFHGQAGRRSGQSPSCGFHCGHVLAGVGSVLVQIGDRMQPKERIICALDVDNAQRAVELVTQLKAHVGVFKVGLELVNAAGIQIFETLRNAGAERFFYDAKLHDIPNTVAGAVRSIAGLGVWCVTVHASGGAAMLRAAVETAHKVAEASGKPRPKILAVTVLTSISDTVLKYDLEVGTPLQEHVAHLARLAHTAGCNGVIASPHEIEIVRLAVPDPDFLIVTPGVRPQGSDVGDQARVMSPGEAVRRGASLLVIGRPIVGASDPAQAAQAIADEIARMQDRH